MSTEYLGENIARKLIVSDVGVVKDLGVLVYDITTKHITQRIHRSMGGYIEVRDSMLDEVIR